MQQERSERAGLAWLGRKVGWGLRPGELDRWQSLGVSAAIDELVYPDEAVLRARPDPFAEVERRPDQPVRMVRQATMRWIEGAVDSPRPLETFMEFFWSDFFAVSVRSVRPHHWMFEHMNLLAEHALGNFAELLRAVTVDPAMLDFLDGRRSTKDKPNENYGRELLELYSVGVGNFTEDDVASAARALTGWKVRRNANEAQHIARFHDDAPQTLLGVDGVHDVETTIAAVLDHPATAPRVVGLLADAILGPGYRPNLLTETADRFRSDWEVAPVVKELLELGVAGHASPSVLEPLAWYVSMRRLPMPPPPREELRTFFSLSGQIPMQPPNVGGFPGADAYLSASATIGRVNMASRLAEAAAPSTLRSIGDNVDELAERLSLVDGFAPATRAALDGLAPGVERLAAAMASPDVLVVS